jgi:hypothetical protein
MTGAHGPYNLGGSTTVIAGTRRAMARMVRTRSRRRSSGMKVKGAIDYRGFDHVPYACSSEQRSPCQCEFTTIDANEQATRGKHRWGRQ